MIKIRLYYMNNDSHRELKYREIQQCLLPIHIKSQTLAFNDEVMLQMFCSQQDFKLQMTSESNISFYYAAKFTHKQLANIADINQQTCQEWLAFLFTGQLQYTLQLKSSDEAILIVQQTQKYKSYQLAELPFELMNQQSIRESVMFRYQRMKQRQRLLDEYWEHISGIVRIKNPSLLLQMEQKTKKNVFK